MSDKPPIEGMKKIPMGLPMMAGAWAACCLSLADSPECLNRFEAETGHDLSVLEGRSFLAAMIDKATGRDKAVALAWFDWVTETIWGEA